MSRRIPSPLFFTLLVIVILTGCGKKEIPETHVPAPVKKERPARTQHKPVDLKAQQKSYDLGLKYYADEKYREARKAFQQAIEYGPGSSLASKARENLMKTEQVLRTLRELEQE